MKIVSTVTRHRCDSTFAADHRLQRHALRQSRQLGSHYIYATCRINLLSCSRVSHRYTSAPVTGAKVIITQLPTRETMQSQSKTPDPYPSSASNSLSLSVSIPSAVAPTSLDNEHRCRDGLAPPPPIKSRSELRGCSRNSTLVFCYYFRSSISFKIVWYPNLNYNQILEIQRKL